MKQTVTKTNFIQAFRNYDRFDQFGAAALERLFDHLEELEQDTGEEKELDVISICCDYSVDSVEDIASNYDIEIEGMDEDEAREAVIDFLNENTTVIDDDVVGQILYCSAF
jgi:hypothetical protein